MKTLFFLLTWVVALNLFGQCPYFQKYMSKGNAEMRKDSFDKAIYAYSIAMRLCPDSTDKVQKRIVEVFTKINELKVQAEAARRSTEIALITLTKKQKELEAERKIKQAALDDAEKQRDEKEVARKDLEGEQKRTQALLDNTEILKSQAETALKKAKDLIAAYYFYEGKYALAFKNGKYCYIDTMGNEIEMLGRWDKAEQFDIQTGYARVGVLIFKEMRYYLLDTAGKYYPTVNTPVLPLSKNHPIEALDLGEKKGFPFDPWSARNILGKLEDTKILILNTKIYTPLDKLLKKFINLEKLDLSDNGLKSLPNSLYDLKKLTYLDLRNNPLSEVEKMKIFRLLPKCKIDTGQYNAIDSNYNSEINYKFHYEYLKSLVEKKKKNHQHWYDLSYYALFVDKPTEAIQAAQKALTLAPKKQSVETNLALGYLLDNQWAKAEAIYQRWKGKKFPDDKQRLCDDLFLKDISDLERAGVKHADFEKVKDFFKR